MPPQPRQTDFPSHPTDNKDEARAFVEDYKRFTAIEGRSEMRGTEGVSENPLSLVVQGAFSHGFSEITSSQAAEVRKYAAVRIRELSASLTRLAILNLGSGSREFSDQIRAEMGVSMLDVDLVLDPSVKPQLGRFVRADVERLPFRASSQDLIFSSFLLNYTNKERAVREMNRVLKNGGHAILILHHPGSYAFDNLTDTDNPLSLDGQVTEIFGILVWLEKMRILIRQSREKPVYYAFPSQGFQKDVRKAYGDISGGIQLNAAADNIELLDAALVENEGYFRKMLLRRLLLKTKPNLFQNETEIKDYFDSMGFDTAEEVTEFRDAQNPNRPYAFGVVLRKVKEIAAGERSSEKGSGEKNQFEARRANEVATRFVQTNVRSEGRMPENAAKLRQPAVFVIEKARIGEMLKSSEQREMLKWLFGFAGVNKGLLHIVVPDRQTGSGDSMADQWLADLKQVASVYEDIHRVAKVDGLPVFGFSDAEGERDGRFLGQFGPTFSKKIIGVDLDKGRGFVLAALLGRKVEELPQVNGFHRDARGLFTERLMSEIKAFFDRYVVIQTAA